MKAGFWSRPRWDPELNSDICSILLQVQLPDPRTALRAIPYLEMQADDIRYAGHSGIRPAIVAVKWADGIAFFFSGTNFSAAQIQGLIDGYRPTTGVSVEPHCNQTLLNAWLQIKSDMLPASFVNAPTIPMYFCGHSYGGAVATIAAQQMRNTTRTATTEMWSYGAPRPGRAAFCNSVMHQFNTRFYMPTDPVRYIPPHSLEVPFLTALSPTELVQNMNAQVQNGQGFAIKADGKVEGGTGEPGPVDQPTWSLYAWITGTTGMGNADHSLVEYRTRFDKGIVTVQPSPPPVNPGIPSDPDIENMAQINHIREMETPIVIAAAASGLGPPINVVITQGTGGQAGPGGGAPTRYRLKKVGRIWTVQFLGEVVAIGPGKRHARKIRRQLNRTLTQVSA